MNRIRQQYAKNAAQLRQIANEAKGKRSYRGKPFAYWDAKAREYELRAKGVI
jgi:hypothetical protein